MKPKSTLRSYLLLAGSSLLAVSSLPAATFYWDGTSPVSTAGFGTAGGTWAQNSTTGFNWTTSNTGAIAGSPSQVTADTDSFNFGTATAGVAAGSITVSGTVTMGDTTYGAASGAIVLTGGTINLGAAKTITVNNASNTIGSVIGGAATSLTKAGAGKLVLTGNNTYSGTTIVSGSGTLAITGAHSGTGAITINGGTLDLGDGTATGSLASTALTVSAGTFSYTTTGTNTQTFNNTSINSTAAVLSVNAGNTLNLGTVARSQGVRFDFSSVGAGIVAADTASNNNGIMSSFTLGDTWAVANGPGNAISGLPNGSYTLSSVAGTTAANYLNGNIDVNSSPGALGASITANSLRFSSAAANTLTLTDTTNTLSNGGILVASTVGSFLSTINGGTLAGAASKDLSIIQNNASGGLTISSVIGDNTGATSLAKSGAGLLTLSNSNTFTGGVFLHGGQLTLANAGALNSTTPNNVTFSSGSAGRLTLNGNSLTVPVLSGSNAGPAIIENANAANVTLTINGATNSNFAGIIQNGTGGGTLALTKDGAATLTLSGANTFTGGTTLTAGTLAISNATSLGAGSVSVTGNSRINAAALTYANDISVAASTVLSLQNTGAANSTATFSGAVTGSGGVTLVQGTNSGTTIALSSANNTFTGNVTLPTGTGANDFISFGSIGDGGSIVFGRPSWRSAATYTGAAGLEFDTRTISLATTFGGTSGLDGGGNPINMFANNGAGTVTINTAMGMTSIASSGFLFLGGTNTGNNTFAGAIADPTGANTLGIGKWDAGKWILTHNTNSFEGKVFLAAGTLSVGVIDVAANAQPLGKGSLIQLGYRNADTGTLEYTGSANAVTDKQIELGQLSNSANSNFAGGGVILNNGLGTLTFSNSTFNSTAGVPVTGTGVNRTLTLGGTNTGDNTISGTIQDNSTTIVARSLLTKTGAGTWVLSGDNTYSGNTAVNGGKLKLNYSPEKPNSKLSDTGTLTLGAGTTLELAGGTHTEIVASTTISSNSVSPASVIQTGGSSVLQMGTITRSTGAYITFSGPGIATTNTLNNSFGIIGTWATVNNGNDWAVNSTNAANGPITAPVYTDVARLGGSQVIADASASQVRIIEGAGSAADITLGAATTTIATLTQSTTGGASVSVIDPAGQTLAVGAILAQNGAGSLTIGNGTNNGNIQALSAGGDLLVNTVGTSNVTINSTIADNVTSTLTKIGAGTLTLSGTNTYAGGTTIINNGGTLRITNAAALGTGAVTISTAGTNTGTLELALTGTNSITNTFNGFSSANNLGSGNAQILNTSGDNTITSNLTITGTGGNGLNVASNGGLLTLSGTITHTIATARTLSLGGTGNGVVSGPINNNAAVNLSVTKSGSGTWTLSNATNTYAGNTTVSGGTLAMGANDVLPAASAVSIGAGTLDAATYTDTTAGTLDVTAAATINLGSGGALAFANSSAVSWTGGTLNITGDFVSGASIQFGTSSGGLTPTQLGLITVNGSGPVSIDSSGYLTTAAVSGYAAWQATNGATGQTFGQDHDNDGVDNGTEFFLGGTANTTGFTALPGVVNTAGILSVTWTKAGTYTGTYGTHFVVETSTTLTGAWTPEPEPGTVTITGNDVKYTFPGGPGYTGKRFARLTVTGP